MSSPPLLPTLPIYSAPAVLPTEQWPAMLLLAATVLLEAENQPADGQLAVAWVIKNRVMRHPRIAVDPASDLLRAVILAPRQFSCWNDDYDVMRRARLAGVDPVRWENAWKWGSAAWWSLAPDPTNGAGNYLNEDVTRRLHGGSLPSWFDPQRVTVRIGDHTFLA